MKSIIVSLLTFAALANGHTYDVVDKYNPYNLTDCRNETALGFEEDGETARLRVLSWHIHYVTNTSDMERFYTTFVDYAENQSWPIQPAEGDNERWLCPFGPNFGLEEEKYPYFCSLEDSYEEAWAAELAAAYNAKHGIVSHSEEKDGEDEDARRRLQWNDPQRAFFVPNSYKDEAWEFAKSIKGGMDLVLHPNTGCMHDDHSLRAEWSLGLWNDTEPVIMIYEFPCNMPATGCNDNEFPGLPSCGCQTPLDSDSPEDSCPHCVREYNASW